MVAKVPVQLTGYQMLSDSFFYVDQFVSNSKPTSQGLQCMDGKGDRDEAH